MRSRNEPQGGVLDRVDRDPEADCLLSVDKIVGRVLVPRCLLVGTGLLDENVLMEHQDEIVSNAQQRAESNVKTTFMLQEIAKAENITVEPAELQQRVAMYAAQNGRPVKKVIKELQQQNGLGDLQHQILIGKTLDFLKSNASVTEVDPPKEEA